MSSRGFSLLVALLLAASLSLKAAAATGNPEANPRSTVAAVQAMLAGSGFDAQVRQTPSSPGWLVEAAAGDCRLQAGEYPVHDTYADVYRGLAGPDAGLVYVHRGQVHESPPKARSMLDFFVWRELSRVGIEASRAPVVALIASPACDLGALPWGQVALVDG